jgi:hypothetical protein
MRSWTTIGVSVSLLAVLGTAAPVVRAQTDDEEQAARDRRYIERMRATREAARTDPRAAREKDREEIVTAFLARADGLIRDKNYRSGSTDAYLVKTDDPRLDARGTATLLSEFRSAFDRFWEGRLELLPYDDRSRMYLFWSYYKYNQLFTGKERFDEFRTTGHYRGFLDTVVIHTDGTDADDLADVLVHEAAHQLVGRRITGPDVDGPPWLEEGLAEYFAYTRQARDGTFEPGEIGAKRIWPFLEGKAARPGAPAARRDAAVRRIRKDADWSVGVLLAAEPRTFYAGDVQANYGAAWLLVHYLFHGDGDRHAQRFAGWIAGLRDGATTSLPEALGVAPAELHEAFAVHARELTVR